ncbi:MAG: IclR family transcriptional regulator C-terminal domain-containing protein, partial [Victivallales bacterium]
SVGAALLCGESDDEIMELIQECSTDLAEKQEPELVLKAVGEVRTKGYAVNLRRNRWNIAAMSMPVRDAEGSVIAAITLIGAESDFAGKRRSQLASVLKDAVRKCSEGSC